MDVKGGVLRDISVLVLYCLRLVGMAPVSIKRIQDGYRFDVNRFYAIYGVILMSILNIWHVGIAVYDVVNGLTKHATVLGNNTFLVTLLWLSDIVTLIIITQFVALRNIKQTQGVIECCQLIDRIKGKVKVTRATSVGYKLFLVTFVVTRITLDAVYMVYLIDAYKTTSKISYFYVISATKYVIVSLLQVQIFASYLEVALQIKYIKEELQDLNDTLNLDDSDSSYYAHSVNKKLKHIGESFESTKNAFSKMNENHPGVHVIILFNLFCRIILALHGIAMFFLNRNINLESSLQDKIPICISFCFAIHNVGSIMLMMEPFANMEYELRVVKLLLGSIMTMKNYVYNVFPYVDMFYRDLISFDFTYTPLGVVTMQRSIVVKVIGVGITCIAAIVQFQKKK